MKIGIIIPILYTPKNRLYQQAVKSLAVSWRRVDQIKHSRLEVILVFNSFPSIKHVPRFRLPGLKVTVITNELNRGFTGAVNDGIWLATYNQEVDWCLVFNDDAQVDKNFFERLLPQLSSSKAVVSCGVRNKDGTLQSAGLQYFHSGLTEPLTRFATTPFFSGTAFFVSKKLVEWSFREFGWMLAEFFFAYGEDLELSLRLSRARKTVYIHPETLVTHLGSATAKRGSAFQLYWGYRNLLLVILLHWSWSRIILSLPQLLFGQLYMIGLLIWKRHWLVYPKILTSLWKNRQLLRLYRRHFNEKLTYSYSF